MSQQGNIVLLLQGTCFNNIHGEFYIPIIKKAYNQYQRTYILYNCTVYHDYYNTCVLSCKKGYKQCT